MTEYDYDTIEIAPPSRTRRHHVAYLVIGGHRAAREVVDLDADLGPTVAAMLRHSMPLLRLAAERERNGDLLDTDLPGLDDLDLT